ncbi:MAG: gliding motility lipoprotein GldH [Muribaculaceae bacterium]|nr:gliding motility lipoprotein GldH [Muribaculaceae bacterium]MDE6540711.1 gliding motility lipoprotein GldH [Muribaculaceae bacterium]
MRHASALILPLLVWLTAACAGDGADVGYSAFRAIPAEGWRYTDTLEFAVTALPGADSAAMRGDVVVCVRHSDAYPYSNLWLELEAPDGRRWRRDVELADVFGTWHGRGMGLTFEHSDTLLRGLELAPGDTLRLHHCMRVDTLEAIEQVGLFFLTR